MQGRLNRLVGIALVACMLAACVTPTGPQTGYPNQERQLAQAEKLSKAGDHVGAGRAYQNLAEQSAGELRDRFNLRAAREFLNGGDLQQAQKLVSSVSENVPSTDFALRATVLADLALHSGRADRALAELDRVALPLPRELAPDLLQLRTQALFALGRPVLAINTALEREKFLATPQEMAQNHRMIWQGVQQSAAARVDLRPPPGASPLVSGWLELGRVALAAGRNPFTANAAVRDWRARYPTHPANELLSSEVLPQLGQNLAYPPQIALLLPLSGKQQQAGAAVRDGFIAALLQQDASTRPLLNVYDTAQAGAIAAYRRATSEGAQFIVGPLLKEDVASIAQLPDAAVPTLALNELPDNVAAPSSLFQFGLAPEDEARQVADRIANEGRRSGIALLPNNEWGKRLFRAFEAELKARGGSLAGLRFYDPAARDYSQPITDVLLIGESRARANQLNGTLGIRLEFEPRRRSDVEFVFVAAQPVQGRSLKPALKFHLSGEDLPVYATSDIYEPDAASNSDLDGVIFPDMPSIISPDEISTELRASLLKYWPTRARGRTRLYAFGFDAYRLVPMLRTSSRSTGTIDGMTGRLTVSNNGKIERTLEWARVVNGQAQPLGGPQPTAMIER